MNSDEQNEQKIYEKAVEFAKHTTKTIKFHTLQRELQINYPIAVRILDRLRNDGFVPVDTNPNRTTKSGDQQDLYDANLRKYRDEWRQEKRDKQ